MPQQGMLERMGASRVMTFAFQHPRLVKFLLVTLVLLAIQGGAAAETTLDTDGATSTSTGPNEDE